MRRFSVYTAVAAMLFALIAAPLLHVHDEDGEDDHHHAGSLVHAHLPQPGHIEHHEDDDHAEHSVEAAESAKHGRSIDMFAVNTPALPGVQTVAEFSQSIAVLAPILTRAVVSVQVLRAHSPPDRFAIPPRSPPSL